MPLAVPHDPMTATDVVIQDGYEVGRFRFDVTIKGGLRPQIEEHVCWTLVSNDAYCSFSVVAEMPIEVPEAPPVPPQPLLLGALVLVGLVRHRRRTRD